LRLVTKKLNFSAGAPELLLVELLELPPLLELLLVSPLDVLVLDALLLLDVEPPEPPVPRLIWLSLPHPVMAKRTPPLTKKNPNRSIFIPTTFPRFQAARFHRMPMRNLHLCAMERRPRNTLPGNDSSLRTFFRKASFFEKVRSGSYNSDCLGRST